MSSYKPHSLAFRCIAWCLISQVAVSTLGLAVASAADLRLPAGSAVIIRLDQTISTKTNSTGDSVRMSVAADVAVAGSVVIQAGAVALGEISHVKKPGNVGAPGEIGVDVSAVQGVNGEMIRVIPQSLSGEGDNKQTSSLIVTLLCCVLGLLMKGGEASIAAGQTINTHTAQEVVFESAPA
jgi:hypothetical protein